MSNKPRSAVEDARKHSLKVRLHMDELRAFEKLARRKRITVSELVRKLLYDAFPPLEW